MKAVILAGGLGTRLQSVISDLPKPMAPVGGKPFLEYLIAQLASWGIRDIILSVGYKADLIESHFGDGKRCGVKIRYSREEEPLGTGGALKKAMLVLDANNVLVLNGDSFTDLELDDFNRFHQSHNGIVSMALVGLSDTSRYGKVELGPYGTVSAFREKEDRGPGLINSGYYLVRKGILSFMRNDSFSLEREIFPLLMPTSLHGKVYHSFFVDIGTPEDYALLQNNGKLIEQLTPLRHADKANARKPSLG
jgi:D-glycero-alpha-D-manno-heptose 1-phosphate guanylyltransferase